MFFLFFPTFFPPLKLRKKDKSDNHQTHLLLLLPQPTPPSPPHRHIPLLVPLFPSFAPIIVSWLKEGKKVYLQLSPSLPHLFSFLRSIFSTSISTSFILTPFLHSSVPALYPPPPSSPFSLFFSFPWTLYSLPCFPSSLAVSSNCQGWECAIELCGQVVVAWWSRDLPLIPLTCALHPQDTQGTRSRGEDGARGASSRGEDGTREEEKRKEKT